MNKRMTTMLQHSLSAGRNRFDAGRASPLILSCASVDCNLFYLSVDFFLLRVYIMHALQLKYVRLHALHECPSASD